MPRFDFRRLLIFTLPIAFTVWASFAWETELRTIALITVWGVSILYVIPVLARPMRWLRRVPALLWLLWLTAIVMIIAVWLVEFDPAIGVPVTNTEQLWLVGMLISVTVLPFAGYSRDESVSIGWIASPLITLTTLVIILIGIELGLRYLWVMSDNFQFSKMHQNWQRLYWNPINEAGYRDYPVPEQDATAQQILVMGDSLVTGYGVDSIDDTFPHQLNALLGEDVSVNIVAQPGWGVASSFGALQAYPIVPDTVILSHYINDINEGTAAQQYGRAFPQIRVEPTEQQKWWTDHFYIANFLYYRVFLYTQFDSLGLYNDWVYGAYSDANVSRAYQQELQAVVDWTSENNIELVVLVWSDLVNIEASRPLVDPITEFFSAQDIVTVNMADYLEQLPVGQRIVNPFDAHPSAQSHAIAAEQLVQYLSDS